MNGRDWTALALMAPGSRTSAIATRPWARSAARQGGRRVPDQPRRQQVTQSLGGVTTGQLPYSRDTIAEFEFLSNRFDATQGRSRACRSTRHQVGHEPAGGTFSGSTSAMTLQRENPSPRRCSVSPLAVRRYVRRPGESRPVHYFADFEYEREPRPSSGRRPTRASTWRWRATSTKKLAAGGSTTDLAAHGCMVRAT